MWVTIGGGFLGGGMSVFFRIGVGASFGERRRCGGAGGPVLLDDRCGGREKVL